MRRWVALLVVLVTAVAHADAVSPRRAYNDALSALGAGDLDAAEKGFLDARDRAGPDAMLRYRAAFNLGITYARRADGEAEAEAKAEGLRQSAAWFRDAVRLSPDDEDARVNLEIVLRRLRALADELNRGKNGLEARLERLLEEQRGLRDGVRQLVARIEAAEAKSEPVAFQEELHGAAARERALLADAGTLLEMAASELDGLKGKPDEDKSSEEKARSFQLQGVVHYVERARQAMADTRHALRTLAVDRAHQRADQAVHELKRAREQLQDPVTILKGLAQDQAVLRMYTAALERIADKTPRWLSPDLLAEREGSLRERTVEIATRLGAAESSSQEAARARPHVEAAAGRMEAAATKLTARQLAGAFEDQGRAIGNLARAVEQFAGVRELIEIAYAHQARAVEDPESAPQAAAQNLERMERLEGLLEKEAAAVPADDPEAEAKRDLYRVAEEKRREVVAALERRAMAEALEKIEDLRRLFFSVVEHLKQLARDQAGTIDETASTQTVPDDVERQSAAGPLAEVQSRHAVTADAIARALEDQAGAAAGQGEEGAEALSQAAVEVNAALSPMQSAAAGLAQAASQDQSYDLEHVIESQKEALEHLENAIRILEPPQPDEADGQEQPEGQTDVSQDQAQRRLQEIRDREAERQRERKRSAVPPEPVDKDW